MFTTSPLRRASTKNNKTKTQNTTDRSTIVVNASTGALTHIGVAFTLGLIIMVMIAATGHLSGAHFNPAATIAFACTRHFPWRDVPLYIGAQLLGAIGGTLTL